MIYISSKCLISFECASNINWHNLFSSNDFSRLNISNRTYKCIVNGETLTLELLKIMRLVCIKYNFPESSINVTGCKCSLIAVLMGWYIITHVIQRVYIFLKYINKSVHFSRSAQVQLFTIFSLNSSRLMPYNIFGAWVPEGKLPLSNLWPNTERIDYSDP